MTSDPTMPDVREIDPKALEAAIEAGIEAAADLPGAWDIREYKIAETASKAGIDAILAALTAAGLSIVPTRREVAQDEMLEEAEVGIAAARRFLASLNEIFSAGKQMPIEADRLKTREVAATISEVLEDQIGALDSFLAALRAMKEQVDA